MLPKIHRVFVFQVKSIGDRIPVIFLLIFLFVWSNVQPVADFAADMDLKVTPWGFSHIVNDWLCILVIMTGAASLFCDAPFHSSLQIYILPRAGHTAWVLGHILYIWGLSFCYVLMILIASIMPFLFRLDLQTGWGKVWGTLARTFLGADYNIQFQVNDFLIGAYRPVKAALLSFLLIWVCCVWLGELIYVLNALTGTSAGTFAAAGFVMLDLTVSNEWLPWFYRISPVTMAQLHTLKTSSASCYGLTPAYAAGFFSLSLLCFFLLLLRIPDFPQIICFNRKIGFKYDIK